VPDVSSTFPIGDHFVTIDSNHCITAPLANGKLDRVLTGWMRLDLHGIADQLAQERGEEIKFKIQTIFDDNLGLDVKNTESIIDEYAVRARLRSELDANTIFKEFLRDIDGYVGHTFDDFAVWNYPNGLPQVGDIIEIDVIKPFESAPGIDFVPQNAPIMVIDVQEQYITVATLELNDKNHAVHGMREFGYEYDTDGSILFYARAISTVGTLSRWLGGGKGEYAFWSAWVDSMSNKLDGLREVESTSGSTCQETNFLKGKDIFEKLPNETKQAFEYWREQFLIVGTPNSL